MKHIYLIILITFFSITAFGQPTAAPTGPTGATTTGPSTSGLNPNTTTKPGTQTEQTKQIDKPLGVADSTTAAETNEKLDKLTELVKKLDEKITNNDGLVAGVLRVAYGVEFNVCAEGAEPKTSDIYYLYEDIIVDFEKITEYIEKIDSLIKIEKWNDVIANVKAINKRAEGIVKAVAAIENYRKTNPNSNKDIAGINAALTEITDKLDTSFSEKDSITTVKTINSTELKIIKTEYLTKILTQQIQKIKAPPVSVVKACSEYTSPLKRIKNIHVEIKDGMLYDIEVTTQDGQKFTNRRAPVEVSEISGRRVKDKLLNGDKSESILLDQILQYDRKTYIGPDDAIFDFTKKEDTLILRRNTNLNNLIEVRLYSDVLGTFFNAKNAIASMEFFWKHELNLVNVTQQNMHFIKYGIFNVAGSRLDNENKVYNYDIIKFTRLGLNQRSFLSMSYTLNFLDYGWPPRPKGQNSLSVNFLAGGNIAQLKDIVNFKNNEDSIRTVFMPYIGFNVKPLVYKLQDRIYIDAGVSFYWQYAPTLRTPVPFKDAKQYSAVPYIVPEVNFVWSPGAAGSKLFFRARYFTSTAEENMKDSYMQLQIGYSQSITELIKAVKDKP